MSNKKQRKRDLEECLNPHIFTLDQILSLADEVSTDPETTRHNATKAVGALRNRVGCRFTGPSDFHRLTHGEQMVYDLSYMQGEVLNGGFHQYLTNSTGETSEDVKLYLREIDAVQTLDLFLQLSKLFPGGKIPRDQAKRWAIVKKWENQVTGKDVFDDLDGYFYKQSEHLDTLIVAYARKHRADFAEPSDDVIKRLQRQDRIKKYYCGDKPPEWVAKAGKALELLEELAKTSPAAQLESETKSQVKALAATGKKSVAIRIYKDVFKCSVGESKIAVEQMLKSSDA
jgi:hypothetical protein